MMPGNMPDRIIREIAGLVTIIRQSPGHFNPRLKLKSFFGHDGIQNMNDSSFGKFIISSQDPGGLT